MVSGLHIKTLYRNTGKSFAQSYEFAITVRMGTTYIDRSTMFFEGYWFETNLPSVVAYFLISLLTVCGNCLVITAFLKDPFHQLRTLNNYYIVNLAISDMLMGLMAETLLIGSYWNRHSDVFFVHYLFAIISGISSLLNMAALSIYRYFAVKKPLSYQGILTRKRILISITLIWLYAIHFVVLPVAGWRSSSYQLYLYGLGCVSPTFVILAAYFGIFMGIRYHTKTLHKMAMGTNLVLKNAMQREKATTKTMFLVLLIFLLFWMPFLLVDVLMVQCTTCRDRQWHLARDITLSFTYFSSAINPFLYAARVRQFRVAFIRICCGKRRLFGRWNRVESILVRTQVDTSVLKFEANATRRQQTKTDGSFIRPVSVSVLAV